MVADQNATANNWKDLQPLEATKWVTHQPPSLLFMKRPQRHSNRAALCTVIVSVGHRDLCLIGSGASHICQIKSNMSLLNRLVLRLGLMHCSQKRYMEQFKLLANWV